MHLHTQVFWWLALLFHWFMSVSGPMPYCLSLCVRAYSVISDSATPRTVAHQDPLSMGFSRQEYWSGLPFPPPVDLPDPEIELTIPALASNLLSHWESPLSLVVQWLKTPRLSQQVCIQSLIGEPRIPHAVWPKKKKKFEWYRWTIYMIWASLVAQMACNVGDLGSIPG